MAAELLNFRTLRIAKNGSFETHSWFLKIDEKCNLQNKVCVERLVEG